MADLVKLQNTLGIRFHQEELLREAMTHKSFAAEHNVPYDNQRLELLGDAVVQIILTRDLYDRYPELQEGDLTKIRSALANQESLAEFARSIHLGEYLIVGHGEEELHGRDRESTVSDVFEAFLGALYLDQGLDFATKFLLDLVMKHHPDPASSLAVINPKGALQEWLQSRGKGVPQYKLVAVSGPDHDPIHEVEVLVNNVTIAHGKGSSRKLAEREGAKEALRLLKEKYPETTKDGK